MSVITDLKKDKIMLLDGGMGSELIKRGLPPGKCPELYNIEKPEIVKEIHKDYFNAGSMAVLTNSFGASSIKLKSFNLNDNCFEINKKAAEIAVSVKTKNKYVGGSIGPTGQFLKPQGNYEEKQFEESYLIQIEGLIEGGVDFLLIETQYDLREAACALRAAEKANVENHMPIFISMTYQKYPKGYFTIMGNSVNQCLEELTRYNISAVGANCTLNSEEMIPIVKIMSQTSPLPIIVQANAGKPGINKSGKIKYSQGAEEYASYVPQLIEAGAKIIGGCCGTDPEYIRLMAEIIEKYNTSET